MYHLFLYGKTKRHLIRRGALLTSPTGPVLEGLARQEEHGRLLAGLDEQPRAERLDGVALPTGGGVTSATAAPRELLGGEANLAVDLHLVDLVVLHPLPPVAPIRHSRSPQSDHRSISVVFVHYNTKKVFVNTHQEAFL